MLLYILHLMNSLGWKIPALFFYSSTRMMLAALTSLILTIFLGPYVIKRLYELKTGQSIRVEDCPLLAQLHEKKKNTPAMGGVLILFSMIISLLLWMDLSQAYTWIFFITVVVLGFIGGYDDYLKLKYKNSKGLKGRKKFLAQWIFATLMGAYTLVPGFAEKIQQTTGIKAPAAKEFVHKSPHETAIQSTTEFMSKYYVPFYKKPLFQLSGIALIIAFFITIFVITGSSNAVNLTDGLDGLAAGLVIMVSAVFALVAFLSNNLEIARYLNIIYIEGASEIGVFLCATMGACLGFLWYNGYPAQVFMGDTGSLALGGVLGVAAVLLRREVLLALAGAIFVAEALSVILQVASFKLRNKKRIFLCAPLHHHFEYKGWPETKVVIRFWIVGLILAVIAAISLKVQ